MKGDAIHFLRAALAGQEITTDQRERASVFLSEVRAMVAASSPTIDGDTLDSEKTARFVPHDDWTRFIAALGGEA